MRKVWKFPVPVRDQFELEMPGGAKLLRFDSQADQLWLWTLVDDSAAKETRRFRFAGTGHPLGDGDLEYVGTAQQADGRLIWHLFEYVTRSLLEIWEGK